MPKMKSHSGSKKRFKKTASGKIKRARGFRRHHAWAKDAKKVRSLRSAGYVDASQEKKISRLLQD